jgi:hypothetical protein
MARGLEAFASVQRAVVCSRRPGSPADCISSEKCLEWQQAFVSTTVLAGLRRPVFMLRGAAARHDGLPRNTPRMSNQRSYPRPSPDSSCISSEPLVPQAAWRASQQPRNSSRIWIVRVPGVPKNSYHPSEFLGWAGGGRTASPGPVDRSRAASAGLPSLVRADRFIQSVYRSQSASEGESLGGLGLQGYPHGRVKPRVIAGDLGRRVLGPKPAHH